MANFIEALSFTLALMVQGASASEKDAVIDIAIEHMLSGGALSGDILNRIRELPWSDRIEVMIILRRAGFVDGPIPDTSLPHDQ